MPHKRERLLFKIILKKLQRMPILLINGARQTGKSFLIRDLLAQKRKNLRYETLDFSANLTRAKSNPNLYLTRSSLDECMAVDEAQKAPTLFDEVKAFVDTNKSPGQYIFLGSTEFSHRTKIRESLTGRATRATLYPFTLAETQSKHLDNCEIAHRLTHKPRFIFEDLKKYLERGGFPGIFAIRNNSERISAWNDWLDLALTRDLHQLPGFKADPILARSLLELIAQNPYIQPAELVRSLGSTNHRVSKHIEALEALFVISRIPKLSGSAGGDAFYLCDVGLLNLFPNSHTNQLRTWMCLELLAHISYADSTQLRLFTYSGERGARIDFVLQKEGQLNAIKLYPFEIFDGRDFEVLRAFIQQREQAKAFALIPPHLTSISLPQGVHGAPWNALG